LIDLLAAHDVHRARPVLHRWLDPTAIDADPDRAAAAVRTLLSRDAQGSWPLVRQRLDELPEFGAEALMASADTVTRRMPDLDEQSLAELYRMLAERFPPATDPQYDDAHWVGPREAAGRWRDAVLEALQNAGTEAAVQALRGLEQSSPQRRRLRLVVAEAEDRARTAQWSPTPPDHLRRLARDNEARLVDSPAELLALVVDALGDIQRRLQGQTPDAHLLWDTATRRPKRENEISAYLANQLRDRIGGRAVAINREVEVRATSPTGIGERVDLLISAAAAPSAREDSPPPVSVVAEVKAAWNRDIVQAVRTQLVDRYMADLGTRHGVYVVAWFDVAWWSTDDSARARAARWPSRAALHERLDEAAAAVRAHGAEVACVVLDCSYDRPRP